MSTSDGRIVNRKVAGPIVPNREEFALDHHLVTTTFDLPGYDVTQSLGVVRGIIVRSRSVIGNFGAAIQLFFGGNISIYTSLCERARSDAYELMIRHADELGAHGIVGVRYDATEIGQGVTEVLCYGTAVRLGIGKPSKVDEI